MWRWDGRTGRLGGIQVEPSVPNLERVLARAPLQDKGVVVGVLGEGTALGQEEVVEGAQGEDLGVPVVEAVAIGGLHLARGQALYSGPGPSILALRDSEEHKG